MLEVVCLIFLLARSTSVECFVTSCTPASSSLFVPRLCQKWAAAAAGFANSFSTLPWVPELEFQAFRKVPGLHFEMSHDQYNLQVSLRES